MLARPGSPVCHRARTATSRRSIYGIVYRLKAAYPDWPIVINGGVRSIEAARDHLDHVDGVMLGRAAYQEPWRFACCRSNAVRRSRAVASPKDAASALLLYIERELSRGVRLNSITRHVLGLFHGVPARGRFAGISRPKPSSPAHARKSWQKR